MLPLTPAALSVSHFVNSVGAKAGFASIIGLAILVLLYFAHARETASLRAELEEARQRMALLETRIGQLGRGGAPASPTIAPAPQPASPAQAPVTQPPGAHGPTPATRPAPVSAAAAAAVAPAGTRVATGSPETRLPLAPAGVGAPALSDATRRTPGTPAPVAAPAGATPAAGPASAGAPSQGNGSAAPPPPPPPAPPRPTQQPPSRIRLGVDAGAARPVRRPSPGDPHRRHRARLRTVLAVLVGLLAIAALVVILTTLTSGSPGGSASSTQAQTSNAPVARPNPPRGGASAFNPAGLTVAVLNGTATAGRAHRVALKLSGGGYKLGKVATAADQTHTATTVAYSPGHRGDAVHVASLLKLGPASAAPMDASTQALGCTAGSPCSVVVTVGSDLTTIP